MELNRAHVLASWSIVAVVLLSTLAPCAAEEFEVKVWAGKHDRVATPVSVQVPLDGRAGLTAIASFEGGSTAAQVDAGAIGIDRSPQTSRVTWILDDLEAGASRTYTLRLDSARSGDSAGKKDAVFRWNESSGEHGTSADLLFGERPLLRYVYTKFDPQKIELTKKPFHHVFAPDGSTLITKGPGGLYPHHRGIFFGYNKCTVGGETLDTWHAQKGEHQLHSAALGRFAGPVTGGHAVEIQWNDRQGRPFANEKRHVAVYRQPDGQHLIEFTTLLTANRDIDLDGDPQHAGVQFRAAQYVAEHQKETRFLRPEKWKHLPEDQEVNWPGNKDHIDLPWNAIRFKVDGKPYTVAYLSSPERSPPPPKERARASERLYGRFGEFIPARLVTGEPLILRYRFWIVASHEVTREDIEKKYWDFAEPPKVELVKD